MNEYIEFTTLPEVLDGLGSQIIDIKAAFDRIAASNEDVDHRQLASLLREILPDITASQIYMATKDFIASYDKFNFVDIVYMVGYLSSAESQEEKTEATRVNVKEQSIDRSSVLRLPILSNSYHTLKSEQSETLDLTDINAVRRQRIRYFQARSSTDSSIPRIPRIPTSSSKQNPRNHSRSRFLESTVDHDVGSCDWSPEELSTPILKYAALGFWKKMLQLKKKHVFVKFKALDVNSIYGDPTSPSDMSILLRDIPRLMDALHLRASDEYWNSQYVRTLPCIVTTVNGWYRPDLKSRVVSRCHLNFLRELR